MGLGPVAITEKFAEQCSPVISSNYDTCGTVTRATINHLTVTQLNELFAPGGKFADLDAWFFHSIEMKACGVRRNVLYDWIMSNADRTNFKGAISGTKAVKSPSLLHPFILARQESVVNRGHFKLVNGWNTTGAYTAEVTGPLTAAQIATAALTTGAAKRIIRVEPRHDIPADANWFRSRDQIHIFTREANGANYHGVWRTIETAVDAALTYIDVVIENVNQGTSEPYNADPGQGEEVGYIIPGLNNVNDFERWCQNLPNVDPRKAVPFWFQTFRTARCIDSEYRAVYKRLYDSNPAFREFGDLPLAERNRQDEWEGMNRFVNEFFYNKPISANQTLTLWQNLDQILTVEGAGLITGLGSKPVGYRANFIGVREQLRRCDRLFDLQGNPLNLQEFFQLNYDIYRARKSQGRKVTRIDWWTSSQYRASFFDAMLAYYKSTYQDMAQININVNQNQVNENLGVVWDSYKVKWPSGIEIALVSDEYFDDRRNEFEAITGQAAYGNLLLCLDIGTPGPSGGTIYWAQIASNRRVHTTAALEQLSKIDSTFRCVMETISIEQTLKSDTGTAVVECPLNSAWIEGMSDTTPVGITSKSVAYSNLY